MSASSDTGFFNYGTDASIVIQNMATQASVTLDGRRTKFDPEAEDELVETTAVSEGGLVDSIQIPKGWKGTIEVERASGDFSALVAFMDQAFYQNAPRTYFTITAYNPSGDKTQTEVVQFIYVTFHGYKSGAWERGTVKPSFSFKAQQRLVLTPSLS